MQGFVEEFGSIHFSEAPWEQAPELHLLGGLGLRSSAAVYRAAPDINAAPHPGNDLHLGSFF